MFPFKRNENKISTFQYVFTFPSFKRFCKITSKSGWETFSFRISVIIDKIALTTLCWWCSLKVIITISLLVPLTTFKNNKERKKKNLLKIKTFSWIMINDNYKRQDWAITLILMNSEEAQHLDIQFTRI